MIRCMPQFAFLVSAQKIEAFTKCQHKPVVFIGARGSRTRLAATPNRSSERESP